MKELEIVSLLDLKRNENCWESVGNDPQIYIKGGLKKGWYYLNCEGSSESLRYLKLYIDYGNGFSEENSIIIGKLDTNKCTTRPFEFKQDVVSLRLDPGETEGKFEMNRLLVKKMSTVSIISQAIKSYRQVYSGNILNMFVKVIKKVKENGLSWAWNRAIALIVNKSEQHDLRFEVYNYENEEKIRNTEYNYEPVFSVVIPCFRLNSDYLRSCLTTMYNQSYKRYELILVGRTPEDAANKLLNDFDDNHKMQYVYTNKERLHEMLNDAKGYINGDYAIVLEQEDLLSVNALHYLALGASDREDFIFANEDRFTDNGEHFAPFYKEHYIENQKLNAKIVGSFVAVKSELFKTCVDDAATYEQLIEICLAKSEKVKHLTKIIYHRRAVETSWPDHQITNIVSFYLPQFHAILENDEWWGKGFTEWTNVRKAVPLFEGHYQPHIPSELGYYNLVEDEGIQERQAELAKEYGVSGFCYYYYWFDGKRLLEKPLDALLNNKQIDFPFCICWANESWTRRWDGQEKEVLMKQVHDKDSDKRFIEEIIPILKDERYIRINGKDPILLIYRAELFPDLKSTVTFWKEKCREHGIPNLHVCMVQSFGQVNPINYGCDSAVEFPPHGVYANEISKALPNLVSDFSGNIYDYREVVDRALQKRNVGDFIWYRGAMLSWDNTARRRNKANIFHYADPKEYEKWLVGIVDYTRRFNDESHQMIFVNAWNEWAEGTHLEPDMKFGFEYLEATKRASRVR